MEKRDKMRALAGPLPQEAGYETSKNFYSNAALRVDSCVAINDGINNTAATREQALLRL